MAIHSNLRDILLDRTGASCLSQQLAQTLRQRILSQQLPAGCRLPASRQLAADLGVSRNTVNSALEQLRSQGYLHSRVGSGVYVSEDLPQKDQPLNAEQAQALKQWPSVSRYADRLNATLAATLAAKGETPPDIQASSAHANRPFAVGLPDSNAFPMKIWQSLLRRHSDRQALMGYHSIQGYGPLCQALANYLNSSRGLRCEPQQIVITQGAQQALALCAQLLCNPGDTALVEEPGYAGARKAFTSQGARIQTLGLATNGLDLAQLTDGPAPAKGALLYCTPTHQYPLGGILPAADRLTLLDWAEKNRCWIIEDDYDSEFHYYSQPIAAMAGMAEQTPVIYMGSFSKTLLPGVRLGYLVLPKHLVPVFVEAKACSSGETPLLSQAVVADFIDEGHFVRHLRRMRTLYQRKWEHMRELCKQHLSGLMTPIAQSAGMHLALVFEDQTRDDRRISQQLAEAGFGSTPLSSYYHGQAQQKGLALGFANTSAQERLSGIVKLAELLR